LLKRPLQLSEIHLSPEAGYSSKWKVTHWKSVNTRAFQYQSGRRVDYFRVARHSERITGMTERFKAPVRPATGSFRANSISAER
jgi:hypothetical protein